MKSIISILCLMQILLTQNDFFARYSNDGSKIVFYSYRYDHRSFRDAIDSDVLIMDANGDFETRMTFTNHYMIWPYFMPNDKEIIFSEGLDMSAMLVYKMKLDGSNKIKIGNGGVVSSISSDGKKLAIIFYANQTTELYRLQSGKYKKEEKTLNQIVYFSPDWSHYLTVQNQNKMAQLMIQKNKSGSKAMKIASAETIGQIAWSFDNKKIAFVSKVNEWNHVFIVNFDGSKKRQITSGNFNTWRPSFSPNGKHIVYSASSEEFGANAFIYRLSLIDNSVKQLSGDN